MQVKRNFSLQPELNKYVLCIFPFLVPVLSHVIVKVSDRRLPDRVDNHTDKLAGNTKLQLFRYSVIIGG